MKYEIKLSNFHTSFYVIIFFFIQYYYSVTIPLISGFFPTGISSIVDKIKEKTGKTPVLKGINTTIGKGSVMRSNFFRFQRF
jgi:hypothetical protein